VNHTAETVATLDTSLARRHRRRDCWACRARRCEAQRSMRPVIVVVIHEHPEGPLEMLLVQDQQPVQTLRTNGAHKSLRHSVRLNRVGSSAHGQSGARESTKPTDLATALFPQYSTVAVSSAIANQCHKSTILSALYGHRECDRRPGLDGHAGRDLRLPGVRASLGPRIRRSRAHRGVLTATRRGGASSYRYRARRKGQ
jgi:hypothetical protein